MSATPSKINPSSEMLSKAVVGGAGLSVPPITPPCGMGVVVLFVPLASMQNKSPIEMQADMGLPWSGPNGDPYWFPQNRSAE